MESYREPYDLTWNRDPYEGLRPRLTDAIIQAFGDPFGDEQTEQTYRRVLHGAHEALGGSFHASGPMMAALVAEMAGQGMFDENQGMREKFDQKHGVVTPDEIAVVLTHVDWPITPRSPDAPVVVSETDISLARDALEGGWDAGSTEAVMRLDPAMWALRWTGWIWFLIDAADHDGFWIS